MSSEMFYPSGDDVDRMIELAIQCGIDNRGTSWPLELCRVRAKLRALLARTEAGADGVVAYFPDDWKESLRKYGDCIAYANDEPGRVALYDRPQDASGDAEFVRGVNAERREDMSPTGRLRLNAEDDGDMVVTVIDEHGTIATVEFCNSGGKSHNTLDALRRLSVAMTKDTR